MSEIIHSSANSYFLSYKCLIDKHVEVSNFYGDILSAYSLPAITVSAFSCELALKSILHSESGKTPRGHDLNKLFNQLQQKTRIDMVERTIQAYNFKSEIYGGNSPISEIDFYNLLNSHKDTFMTVRYFHEGRLSSVDLDFIEAFMFCLNGQDDDYKAYVKFQIFKKQQLNETKA
ncbi:HEPN domain-containing protein [Bacillus sp. EB600]|uniref:HEPN domain-containing protein n=1 Tax=Bacillus sp. EB600 TaxID=2806345 RepID=UPI00210973D1|nr:HEPN domain-containing protein [Bacillus sp. EB600]